MIQIQVIFIPRFTQLTQHINRWCPENNDLRRKREDDEDDYKEDQTIINEGEETFDSHLPSFVSLASSASFVKAIFLAVTVYSKQLSTQYNSTAQIEPLQYKPKYYRATS
jgi:shikimate kinase